MTGCFTCSSSYHPSQKQYLQSSLDQFIQSCKSHHNVRAPSSHGGALLTTSAVTEDPTVTTDSDTLTATPSNIIGSINGGGDNTGGHTPVVPYTSTINIIGSSVGGGGNTGGASYVAVTVGDSNSGGPTGPSAVTKGFTN
ncbi:hypothetical protein FRC02_002467, partial [Tulasnella sp. 418]